jgi:hypothetical protein
MPFGGDVDALSPMVPCALTPLLSNAIRNFPLGVTKNCPLRWIMIYGLG